LGLSLIVLPAFRGVPEELKGFLNVAKGGDLPAPIWVMFKG
jgi:hypothetical protein